MENAGRIVALNHVGISVADLEAARLLTLRAAWMADNGQPHGSVRYDTDRAWFTIQGRPAALRELAEALLRCAELTEQTYPAPAPPVVEGVAG